MYVPRRHGACTLRYGGVVLGAGVALGIRVLLDEPVWPGCVNIRTYIVICLVKFGSVLVDRYLDTYHA